MVVNWKKSPNPTKVVDNQLKAKKPRGMRTQEAKNLSPSFFCIRNFDSATAALIFPVSFYESPVLFWPGPHWLYIVYPPSPFYSLWLISRVKAQRRVTVTMLFCWLISHTSIPIGRRTHKSFLFSVRCHSQIAHLRIIIYVRIRSPRVCHMFWQKIGAPFARVVSIYFGVALTVVCRQQFGAVLECFINFIMHAPLGMAQCAQGVITNWESRLGPTHSPALVFF